MYRDNDVKIIFAAGLVGGLMEIIWVALYGWSTGAPIIGVSQEISATIFGTHVVGAPATVMGILVHMILSFVLSAFFVYMVWKPFMRQRSIVTALLSAMMALTLVWGVNFFVILPVMNPVFVAILPLGVTLVSKILFGLGMGLFLVRQNRVSLGTCHS